MADEILVQIEDRMKKTVEALKKDLSTIRTGVATPAILEGVRVSYYGNITPLNQCANIGIPDPKTIVIQPWEKTLLGEIEKVILAANLGITPFNDGNVIRLNIPPLSEERRKDFVKIVKKKGEDGKIVQRNIRREGNEAVKKQEKDKKITEDQVKTSQTKIQQLTDKYIAQIDEIIQKKEQDILKV